MEFFERFRNPFRLIGSLILIFILLLFGWGVIKVIFFPAAEEVLYLGEIIYNGQISIDSEALRPATKNFTLYELKVGNTGKKDQMSVEIHLPTGRDLDIWEIKVLFIIASTKQVEESVITHITTDKALIYTIKPLPANRMAVMKISSLSNASTDIFADPVFQVKATGRVVKADPQMTILVRFFRVIFAIFI